MKANIFSIARDNSGTEGKMTVETVVIVITTVSTVEGIPGPTSMGEITHLATHRTLDTSTVPPTPTPTMIKPTHDPQASSHRAEILGGVIGGASCLMLIMLALILWWRRGCRCVRCRLKGRKPREQVIELDGHYAAEIGTDPRNRSTFYSRDPIVHGCLPPPLFDPTTRERHSSVGTTYSEFIRSAEAKEKARLEMKARQKPVLSRFPQPPGPSYNFSRPFGTGSWRDSYNEIVNMSYNDNYKLEQIRAEQIRTPTTLTTVTPDLRLSQTPSPLLPDRVNAAVSSELLHHAKLIGTIEPQSTPEILDPGLIVARYKAQKRGSSSSQGCQRLPTLHELSPVSEKMLRAEIRNGKAAQTDDDNSSYYPEPEIEPSPFDDVSIAEPRDWDLPDKGPSNRRFGFVFFPDRGSIEIQEGPFDDRTPPVDRYNWPLQNSRASSEKSHMVKSWFKSSPSTEQPESKGNFDGTPLSPLPLLDVPQSANAIRSTHENEQDIHRFSLSQPRAVTL